MTLVISVGKWGGVYYSRGYLPRLCIGWVAFTVLPEDFDSWIQKVTGYNE